MGSVVGREDSSLEHSRGNENRTQLWKSGAKLKMQEAEKLTNDEN